MSQKRVLFLHEDLLLTNLFREKLEDNGITVDTAALGEDAVKLATDHCADVVVLDVVLPDTDIGQLVKDLRSTGGANPIPVIVLPSSRLLAVEAAQEAGAEKVLSRGVNPVADVIDAVQDTLRMEKTAGFMKGMAFRPDDNWIQACVESAPATLTALRRELHDLSREGVDSPALAKFFQRIHSFAEQMAVLGKRPLYTLAAQIESLAFDLTRSKDAPNPSVLRTLGQAVDFLATILPDAVNSQLKDPSAAQVLVVDDEAGACRMVTTAMRLANLKCIETDGPQPGIVTLASQRFDLIFLDIGLPEMTGFELSAKIRTLPLHEKTPIIFLTGMATFQNRVQSSLSGAQDFIGKPFNLAELGLKALIWVFKGQLGQV